MMSICSYPHRNRFLVRLGDNYVSIHAADIAYFASEDGLSFAYSFEGKRFPLDQSVKELAGQLDPNNFFSYQQKLYC